MRGYGTIRLVLRGRVQIAAIAIGTIDVMSPWRFWRTPAWAAVCCDADAGTAVAEATRVIASDRGRGTGAHSFAAAHWSERLPWSARVPPGRTPRSIRCFCFTFTLTMLMLNQSSVVALLAAIAFPLTVRAQMPWLDSGQRAAMM